MRQMLSVCAGGSRTPTGTVSPDARQEWGWLGAALVVAVLAVLSPVAFGGYESGYGSAADDAAGGREVIGTPGAGLGLPIVKAIAGAHHGPGQHPQRPR